MKYNVDIKTKVKKYLLTLDSDLRRNISTDINALEDNPRPPGCKKLKGRENTYRIRAGDYRVVYEIKDKALIVLVIRVAPRGKVYR